MRIVFFACMAALSACVETSPDDYAKRDAQQNVAARMKDPDSSKFSDLFVIRKPATKEGWQDLYTCGFVNSKNSYGAYAGAVRFSALQRDGLKSNTFSTIYIYIENPMQRESAAALSGTGKKETTFEYSTWNKNCVDAAHSPTYSAD